MKKAVWGTVRRLCGAVLSCNVQIVAHVSSLALMMLARQCMTGTSIYFLVPLWVSC